MKAEEKLAKLRHAMQGSEVPVVLLSWMEEVEAQLISLRVGLRETSRTANAARYEIGVALDGPPGRS